MPGNSSVNRITHISFKIGLLLKGINALFEIMGGITLMFLNPSRMSGLIFFITRPELSEDPSDSLMNALLSAASSFSISTQHFFIFYLLSHGITKFVVVLLLWRKKLWAYPLSIALFILFIAYQLYRMTFSSSAFLILLTAFDIVMIFLTYAEYRRIKSPAPGKP